MGEKRDFDVSDCDSPQLAYIVKWRRGGFDIYIFDRLPKDANDSFASLVYIDAGFCKVSLKL